MPSRSIWTEYLSLSSSLTWAAGQGTPLQAWGQYATGGTLEGRAAPQSHLGRLQAGAARTIVRVPEAKYEILLAGGMSPTQQGGLGADGETNSFAGEDLGALVAMSPSGVGSCRIPF